METVAEKQDPLTEQVHCEQCWWQGIRPEDGKCPKCGLPVLTPLNIP